MISSKLKSVEKGVRHDSIERRLAAYDKSPTLVRKRPDALKQKRASLDLKVRRSLVDTKQTAAPGAFQMPQPSQVTTYAEKFSHLSKFLKETSIERYYRRVIAAEFRTQSQEREASKKR